MKVFSLYGGLLCPISAPITEMVGKVGINTKEPCAELDVNGEIAVNCITVINSNGQWVGDPTGVQGTQGPPGPPGQPGQ